MAKQQNGLDSRNALIIKIALFLNFLSKSDYQLLIKDLKKLGGKENLDILKIMLAKKYVGQQELLQLKKACLNFAKAQEDSRFGSLCIEFGFLTASNLDLALEEQKRLTESGQHVRIGDLLVDAGMISSRHRKLVLQKQQLEAAGDKSRAAKTPVESTPADQTKAPETEPAETEPEEDEFDLSMMREIRDPEVVLYIQEDGLKAFMKKTVDFDKSMPLTDLKLILDKYGIIYGLVDDGDLTNFINLPKYRDQVFQVAKGLAPIDGTDARIVYMFEQDYLKAGKLSDDGTIDFKERGDIPFVAQGDVLAEKIPPKPGKDGINVYGDSIPQVEAMDVSFNVGKGVHVTRDELKVIADADGTPKLKQSGELSVNTAYFIEGDVDYNTGHVKFDKNVYITGSIRSGFRVEAIDVVANSIDGGIVKAEGDVFVKSGATESVIEAKGKVRAGYLHRCKINSMGDLIVAKEIVDTDVLIEGAFDMSRGRLFSSKVCAKGGAQVYAIGSEKAKPSEIIVGASLYLEKELENIDKAIEQRQNLLEDNTISKNKFEAELAVLKEKLENYRQSKKRTLSMIDEMAKNGSKDQTDAFQSSIDEADKKIHELSDREALLEAKLKKVTRDISFNAEAVKTSVKDKFTLKRINQAYPAKPILEISGKAFAGTRIAGKHAKLILSQDISRSRIMEMDSSGSETMRSKWEMIITNL